LRDEPIAQNGLNMIRRCQRPSEQIMPSHKT
jgi:hypothetical protein